MKASKITITLTTGNDSFRRRKDVAKALKELAAKVLAGVDCCAVFDVNGNKVGQMESELD